MKKNYSSFRKKKYFLTKPMRESSVMTQNGPSLALEVLHKQLAALTCTLLGVGESDFGSVFLMDSATIFSICGLNKMLYPSFFIKKHN
jgi:hypothetical protein